VPKINYITMRNAVIDYLTAQNSISATYDLSYGMDKRVKSVVKYDVYLEPTMLGEYPRIYIKILSKSERPESFGNSRYGRTLTVTFRAYCIYDSIKNTKINEYKMIRNLETILRNNPSISSYSQSDNNTILNVLGSLPDMRIGIPSKYNQCAGVDFEVKMYIVGENI